MRKQFQFLILLVLVTLFSCASTKKVNQKCSKEEFSQEKVDSVLKNYSIKIPENWYSYNGVHCYLTHSPIAIKNAKKTEKMDSKYYNLAWVRVTTYQPKKNQNFNSIEAYVNNTINKLNNVYNEPKIEVTKLHHKTYGEYRVLKYSTVWYGREYIKTNVVFFYKEKPYTIIYDVNKENFTPYLNDFAKIVESFIIIE